MKIALSLGLLALFCGNALAAPKPSKGKVAVPSWKPATLAQRQAAAKTIRAQLNAFKRDDWEMAERYQAQNLRRMFGSTTRFRTAIEKNYPQFADFKAINFDRARAMGGRVEIYIRLTGKDGVQLRALYHMIMEKGMYRVEGVEGGAALAPERGTSQV